MEWDGENLARVLTWLEQANGERYAQDRRLDPFATSMRDFDDVSEDLQHLRDGLEPDRNDPRQRIVDLRAAELADANQTGLSPLGQNTLAGWERHGVSDREKSNELARHLILVAEASRAGVPQYESFVEYWSELKERYSAIGLIDNWDALFTLNYLDFRRTGYCPGDRFRKNTESIEGIEFDLDEVAEREGGSAQAIEGAKRIRRAIESKVPRGRHRATFCCALEIMAGGQASMEYVVEYFGIPRRPRYWSDFDEVRESTIREIVKEYGLLESTEGDGDTTYEAPDDERHLELPENINFENVLVDLPPKATERQFLVGRKFPAQGSKADHIKKAIVNQEVGGLGEEFAIRFERWRLRERPDLQEQICHISKVDDSVGYDILSFEEDGRLRFVEVKSTLGELKTPFFISAHEAETAEEKKEKYVILRVFDLRESPKCCEIYFPFEGVIQLSPSSFIVTFV